MKEKQIFDTFLEIIDYNMQSFAVGLDNQIPMNINEIEQHNLALEFILISIFILIPLYFKLTSEKYYHTYEMITFPFCLGALGLYKKLNSANFLLINNIAISIHDFIQIELRDDE